MLTTIGKNTISAVIATLETIPYPSHTMSSGATANTGTVWLAITSGYTARSIVREMKISSARPMPTANASANPTKISRSVTAASPRSSPRSAAIRRAIRLGAGRM